MRAIAVALSLLVLTVSAQSAEIRSHSGLRASVASVAQHALQCVVDYVERAGIRIKSMRGFGPGTVSASLHPSGQALDINQYGRGLTRPAVSHAVANAAGRECGVVSGGTWHDDDVGHWNLAGQHRYSSRSKRREAPQSKRIQVVEALPDRFKPQ